METLRIPVHETDAGSLSLPCAPSHDRFIIRPAREDDGPDLLAMIRELACFENLEDELCITAADIRKYLFGTHSPASALIALCNGQSAGYAVFYQTFSTFVGRPGLFLEDVYVRPDFRRRGLGGRLLKEVAQIGVERHCGRFEWIALRWNQDALSFYKRLGAQVLDEWVMLRLDNDGMRELTTA